MKPVGCVVKNSLTSQLIIDASRDSVRVTLVLFRT